MALGHTRMKVDKYYDPYEDLEKQVLQDLEYAATRLGGTSRFLFFSSNIILTF